MDGSEQTVAAVRGHGLDAILDEFITFFAPCARSPIGSRTARSGAEAGGPFP